MRCDHPSAFRLREPGPDCFLGNKNADFKSRLPGTPSARRGTWRPTTIEAEWSLGISTQEPNPVSCWHDLVGKCSDFTQDIDCSDGQCHGSERKMQNDSLLARKSCSTICCAPIGAQSMGAVKCLDDVAYKQYGSRHTPTPRERGCNISFEM